MGKMKAAVFDLYGTLIYLAENTGVYARLLDDLGIKKGVERKAARVIALTEDFNSLGNFVKRIKPETKLQLDRYEDDVKIEVKSAVLYDEVERVLHTLKIEDVQMGLISNLGSPYKQPFFDLKLQQYFEHVLFSCEQGFRKPDPQLYGKMIGLMGYDAQNILMTGDKFHNDVEGAKAIGMNAVLVDRSAKIPNSISSLEGVLEYFL